VAGHSVLVSDDFGPALLGLRTPRIVLPGWVARLDTDTVSVVCRHEAEHRAAGDTWLLAAGALLVALLPWNAPLWWQVVRLRSAVELDCDRRVLRSGVSRTRYARVLFTLGAASRPPALAAIGFLQRPALLERRLNMLIKDVRRMGPIATTASVCAVALLTLAACEAPAPTLVAAPQVTPEAAAERQIFIAGGMSQPLILVDGVRMEDSAPLGDLDPNTIESIEVIKGPAAVRLFGADAVNGVVQIHLKSDGAGTD
jgi:hypothetical protein